MKKLSIIILVIVIILAVIFGGIIIIRNISNNNEEPDRVLNSGEKVEVSLEDFDISFLKLENNKENLVYSPLSIKYALSMLNEGASGETKAEIENVIAGQKLTKYESMGEVLSFANGAYIRDKYENDILDSYVNTLSEKYDAEVVYDAFKNADNVNKWIEEKTLGIIKKLLTDDVVKDPDLMMMLINALAIDMEWELNFSDTRTRGQDFYLADGSTMEATTMEGTVKHDAIGFYRDSDVIALSMDLKKYEDTQLEFVAIMPNGDLSEYIADVSMNDINEIIANMISSTSEEAKDGLVVSIPKFKYDYSLQLKQDLKDLGIKLAFDRNQGDFSNISETIDLFVGDAIHKADIEFSEEGIKAAAVTVFLMTGNSAIMQPPEYVYVTLNRPFMYLIRDIETGEVWFVGTVYTPNSWEKDKSDYEPKYY